MAKATPAKTTKKTPQKAVKQTVKAPAAKVKAPKTKRNFILATVLAAVLLLLANSAIWVNRSIFDTNKFTSISTSALLSESSRNALAGEIVDQALKNNPTVAAVVTEPATNIIAGLLNSQQAKNAATKVIGKVQILVTSKNPQNIEYDLTGIKTTVGKLLTLANKDQAVDKVATLPDTLVIFDASKVPSLYQYGVAMTLLAPFAFLAALALLVMPHVKKSYKTEKLLLVQGSALIGTGIMALFVGPVFRPPVLAQVANANLRVVVENFYNAFIATFNAQTMYLIYAGLIIVAIPLGQRLYRIVRTTYFDKRAKA